MPQELSSFKKLLDIELQSLYVMDDNRFYTPFRMLVGQTCIVFQIIPNTLFFINKQCVETKPKGIGCCQILMFSLCALLLKLM